MTQFLIMCRSLTYAQRAARLLERAGISAAIVKAPQDLSPRGCAYAVSIHRRPADAAALLRKNELLNGKIYRRQMDGEFEEVQL